MMPRPLMEAATPMPAFAPAPKELGGVGAGEVGGGVPDAEGGMMEDAEDAEDVEDVEDKVVLPVGEVAELDALSCHALWGRRIEGLVAWIYLNDSDQRYSLDGQEGGVGGFSDTLHARTVEIYRRASESSKPKDWRRNP